MSDVYVSGTKHSYDGVQHVSPRLWDTENLQFVPQTVATPEGVATNVAVTNFPDVQRVQIDVGMALSAETPATASVGTSSGQILAANADRTGLVVINLSGVNISFGLGAAAQLNRGITLTPFGSWVMDENTMFKGAINAIAAEAASVLSIQEFSE